MDGLRLGGREYGCSMIMLNSHHPFLPSSTRLSSPPPWHHALISPRSYTLTCSHITLMHRWVPTKTTIRPAHTTACIHTHTHTSLCTNRWSAGLIPVSDCKKLKLIPRSRREAREVREAGKANRKRLRRNSSRGKAAVPLCVSFLNEFSCTYMNRANNYIGYMVN